MASEKDDGTGNAQGQRPLRASSLHSWLMRRLESVGRFGMPFGLAITVVLFLFLGSMMAPGSWAQQAPGAASVDSQAQQSGAVPPVRGRSPEAPVAPPVQTFASPQPLATPRGAASRPRRGAKDPKLAPTAPPADAQVVPGTKLLFSGKFLHFSCARSVRDLARNRFECFGNVYIRRPSELLTADYVAMDLNAQELHAEGNVVYFTSETVIYGSSMDFNFVTETGVIHDGRVESDKYQLLGEKIERLATDHFRARDGEYTTCRDCPASWKIMGRDIDLTVNGYAKLSHVFIKVNEAPTFYVPYAIIPVKTKRQSGLLFPRIKLQSANGFTFLQPYFWAISRSADATLGAGYYTTNGPKVEGEFRYMLGKRSQGQGNAYFLRDRQFRDPYQNRWALNYHHNLELPWRLEQKLNWLDVSDRDYVRKLDDIQGQTGEPALVSEAGLARSGRDLSAWVEAKRVRNILTPNLVGFDSNTVQLLPGFTLATANHQVVSDLPLYWGVTGNYARFWRVAPSFDPLYPDSWTGPRDGFFAPGLTPLRRAQRFNLVPELYYAGKIGEVVDFTPSVQYRSYYYLFDQMAPPTTRGYLLTQAEVATTTEMIYGGSVKHKFRPSLTYSNIPVIQQDENHAFIQQIKTPGYQFDQLDIVPVTFESQKYFVPLGNSLTYRLNNRFILKSPGEGSAPATYRKIVDVTAGQSINFIEYRKSKGDQQPLSRFFTIFNVDMLRINANGEYAYYPYIDAPTYNLRLSYMFAKYTRRLLTFERSVTVGYTLNQVTQNTNAVGGGFNWSLNDFIALKSGIAYSFPTEQNKAETPGRITSLNGGITYQSPSQCYKIILEGNWTTDVQAVDVAFNIQFNLTGEGFADLQDGGGVASR